MTDEKKMREESYRTVYGVHENEVVEVQAMELEGGWLVKQGCFRWVVEKEKLSETREGAEKRLKELGPYVALEK